MNSTIKDSSELIVMSINGVIGLDGKGINLNVTIFEPEALSQSIEYVQAQIDQFMAQFRTNMTGSGYLAHI
jgi:hypothetical protein